MTVPPPGDAYLHDLATGQRFRLNERRYEVTANDGAGIVRAYNFDAVSGEDPDCFFVFSAPVAVEVFQ